MKLVLKAYFRRDDLVKALAMIRDRLEAVWLSGS
uniref:Uncharacterized protein n=1 Tax=Candidozyma auris TaxID=498019 RepID=A0A0L0NRS9_CANAR